MGGNKTGIKCLSCKYCVDDDEVLYCVFTGKCEVIRNG